MRRGEIWWVDLGEPRGSAPAFRRPVVVVQEDLLTESQLATVMVAPITSNLRRGAAIGNITLKAKEGGLLRESVVLACQIMTLDKTLFDAQAGALSRRQLADLDDGLKLVLGLRI